LQSLGCRIGQGYLWAKPLPADQARRFLAAPTPASMPSGHVEIR
jgi:EAL domain-containing protein (putative c-di-GMP-specific phosphodiesterase class I)